MLESGRINILEETFVKLCLTLFSVAKLNYKPFNGAKSVANHIKKEEKEFGLFGKFYSSLTECIHMLLQFTIQKIKPPNYLFEEKIHNLHKRKKLLHTLEKKENKKK